MPRRNLPLLRYPLWQVFTVVDTPGYIIIRYHAAEDAHYLPVDRADVRFRVQFFFMDGARWTRCVQFSFAVPSDQLQLTVNVIDNLQD